MIFFFFFQAEDGIRDGRVTGVQTCALPISRPVTGALTRTSCSSLNWTLPVVSRTAVRVRGSAWTIRTGLWVVVAGPGEVGVCADLASLHPAARAPTRAMMRTMRILLPQGCAHGGFEKVDGRLVVAERLQVLERGLAIGALGVEVVQQAHPAAPVGEF